MVAVRSGAGATRPAARIPYAIIGRLLGEKEIRELMERLAEAKPPRKRKR
jgi:hypothetical protein